MNLKLLIGTLPGLAASLVLSGCGGSGATSAGYGCAGLLRAGGNP